MNSISVRARIAITTFALLALVLSAVLYYTLTSYTRGTAALIAEVEKSQLAVLGVFARNALLTREFAQFQPQIESMLGQPDVTAAVLADERGVIVASGDPARLGQPIPDLLGQERRHWEVRKIGRPGQPDGLLAVEFSTARYEELNRSVSERALWAGLIGAALCVVISLFAAGALAARIERVARAAQRVAEGDLSARAEIIGGDEIGKLGRTFDDMVERLERTQDDLEQHRGQLERIVEERTAELRNAQSELLAHERLSTIGQLSASVSHELRNPLGTISNTLQFLMMDANAFPPRVINAAGRAQRNVDRCVRIIKDFEDYSSEHSLNFQQVALRALVDELCANPSWSPVIRVSNEVPGDTTVWADRKLLAKLLIHFLRNSAQAVTDCDPLTGIDEVCVRSRSASDALVVEVVDQAGGIPTEHVDKIFEPLFSTRGFGTGLGLPLCLRIAQEHRATLTLETNERGGTTAVVVFQLPEPEHLSASRAS